MNAAQKRERAKNLAAKRRLETPEQKAKRLARNKKARARHWLKTGVSQATVSRFDRDGWL